MVLDTGHAAHGRIVGAFTKIRCAEKARSPFKAESICRSRAQLAGAATTTGNRWVARQKGKAA